MGFFKTTTATATTTAPAPVEIELLEVQQTPMRVDREKGIIYGVKILGYDSKNGRSYLPEAARKGIRFYEGRQVNIDHPEKAGQPRKVADRFGRFQDVKEQSDGLFGNLHYLTKHAMAEQVAEAAEKMPQVLGMSHNSTGRVVNRGGKYIVEEIISVRSVDLVADPATTEGLFEGSGYMTIPTSGEPGAAAGQTAGGSADQQTKAAFKSMIVAALDDDSLDTAATIKRITTILKSQEKIMGKSDETTGVPNNATTQTTEGVQGGATTTQPVAAQTAPAAGVAELQEQVRQLRAKDEARELLDAAGVKPTAILLESLIALPTKEKRQALVDSLKGTAAAAVGGGGGKKPEPRSTKPLIEGVSSGGGNTPKLPQFKSATERAAFLRSGRMPAAAN